MMNTKYLFFLYIVLLWVPFQANAQRFIELNLKIEPYYRLAKKVKPNFEIEEKYKENNSTIYVLEDIDRFIYKSPDSFGETSNSPAQNIVHRKKIIVRVLNYEIADTRLVDAMMKMAENLEKEGWRTNVNLISFYSAVLNFYTEKRIGSNIIFMRGKAKIVGDKVYQIISGIEGTDSNILIGSFHSSFTKAVKIYE